MKRSELDFLARHYGLKPEGVEVAFAVTGARPTAAQTRHFLFNSLTIGGALSLAAGVVFFIAANWSAIGIFGRFALVEIPLLLVLLPVFWKPPPRFLGRVALLLAFILSGGLLALFGQTYQTGADVYELFMMWALLGLPFALAATWSGVWAAWIVVFNVMLLLFCGFGRNGGWMWSIFGGLRWQLAPVIVTTLANLALWGAFTALPALGASRWLIRLIHSCTFAFACWLGFAALFQGFGSGLEPVEALVALLIVIGACAVVLVHTLRQKRDIYPLAVVGGTVILLGAGFLVRLASGVGFFTIFVVAAWLVAASTFAARRLMDYQRAWEVE